MTRPSKEEGEAKGKREIDKSCMERVRKLVVQYDIHGPSSAIGSDATAAKTMSFKVAVIIDQLGIAGKRLQDVLVFRRQAWEVW